MDYINLHICRVQCCSRGESVPGGEGEQLVVGDVQDAQVLVAHQQGSAVLVQVVPSQVELLQGAQALL